MEIQIQANQTRSEIFEVVAQYLKELNLVVKTKDENRPWGGFFVLEEAMAERSASIFFSEIDFNSLKISEKLSPKILIVAPKMRLSWQYHFRRAEIWKAIGGEVSVATSKTDVESDQIELAFGDIIKLQQGERHRLIGKDNWGIVAEIWQHTDAKNPSDEDDIVRLQDDFGR